MKKVKQEETAARFEDLEIERTLSDEELLHVAKNSAGLSKEIRALEEEAKIVAKEFKKKIETRDADLQKLEKQVSTGLRSEIIPCRLVPDFAADQMVYFDRVNGGEVWRRPLKSHERQSTILPDKEMDNYTPEDAEIPETKSKTTLLLESPKLGPGLGSTVEAVDAVEAEIVAAPYTFELIDEDRESIKNAENLQVQPLLDTLFLGFIESLEIPEERAAFLRFIYDEGSKLAGRNPQKRKLIREWVMNKEEEYFPDESNGVAAEPQEVAAEGESSESLDSQAETSLPTSSSQTTHGVDSDFEGNELKQRLDSFEE